MTYEAAYFRKHIEQEVPKLTTDEERLTAENLYDLLDHEVVDEGIAIELGKSETGLALFNQLLGIEGGLKGSVLRFNEVITSLGAEHNYGHAHRGLIIPLLLRSSIVQGLTYAQATTWNDWRERLPQSRSTTALSRLLIAEPLERTPESAHDVNKPWVSVEGTYTYSAAQRKALGQLDLALIPDDGNRGKVDIETGIHRDHPAFSAYAFHRFLDSTKVEVPSIPAPSYTISIGRPVAGLWAANHIATRRSYRPEAGKLVEIKNAEDAA